MCGNANIGVCWDLVALLFAFLMDLAFDGDITTSIKMVGASSWYLFIQYFNSYRTMDSHFVSFHFYFVPHYMYKGIPSRLTGVGLKVRT